MYLALTFCLVIAVRCAPQESGVERPAGGTLKVDAEKTAGEILHEGSEKAVVETLNVDKDKAAVETLNVGTKKAAVETLHVVTEKAAGENLHAGTEKAAGENLHAGTEKPAVESLHAGTQKAAVETLNVGTEKAAGETLHVGTEGAAGENLNVGTEKAAGENLHVGTEKATDDKLNTEIEEGSDDQDRSVLAYSINSYDLKLPKGLFREVMYTNDWTWFLKYPEYSLDFHYYCPYQLQDGVDLEPGDLELCLSVVELNYWSKTHEREIILDTFDVTWSDGTEDLAERSVIISESHEEIHTVSLAMNSGICKQMKYIVTSTFEVVPSVEDIDCELVKALKRENDHWAVDNIHELAELDEEGTAESEVGDSSTKDKLTIAATEGLSTARSVTAGDLSNYIKSLVASATSTKPDGSVISANYKLPKGLYKEFPIANNWISIKSHSMYFFNYFFYCPFQLKLHKKVWTRRVRFLGCQSVIQLSKYVNKLEKHIVLDSFNIKQRYITKEVIDAINVNSEDGEKTEVQLKLVGNKCSKNIYELQPDETVKHEEIDITCPEKEEVRSDKAVVENADTD